MPNTITNTVINTSTKEAVVYVTLSSDGTEETDYIVFDSSAVATTLGTTDPSDSAIISIYGSISAAATARAWLEWDASTDVLAFDLPPQESIKANFRSIGGLPNQGGSGKTGDITLTTTGLESGDKITLILHVRRD